MSFPFAIFDVDGTLVDSRALITDCMDAAFFAAGLPIPGYEKTRRIIGLSLSAGLDILAPELGEKGRSELLSIYRDIFLQLRSDPAKASPLYNGVSSLLQQLAEDNWVLGIATGKSRRGLDAMVEQFGWSKLFTTFVCADDGPGKPAPFMVLENLRQVGAQANQAVVVGDSEHDMAMAVSANVRGIGVSWGFGTASEMIAAGASQVVDTVDALSEVLLAAK